MNKKLLMGMLLCGGVVISGCQKQNEYVNTEYAYSMVGSSSIYKSYICFDSNNAYNVIDNYVAQTIFYWRYEIKTISNMQIETNENIITLKEDNIITLDMYDYKLNKNIKTSSLISQYIKENIYGASSN